MSNFKVELTFLKSTKGTHVYQDTDERVKGGSAPIPSLYIKKHELPEDPPKKVNVTVDWDD